MDVRADLETALPFADNTFSDVWMNHVFEHLNDPVRSMDEIWRVCQDGATVEIRGPTSHRLISSGVIRRTSGDCRFRLSNTLMAAAIMRTPNFALLASR